MTDPVVTITKYSHSFSITRISPRARPSIISFARKYVQKGYVKTENGFQNAPVKVYGVALANREEFRFHINQLPEFIAILDRDYIKPGMYSLIEEPLYEAADIDVSMPANWVPRDYQEPIIEYLCGQTDVDDFNNKRPIHKFVGIRTGGGKTSMALKAISVFKKRVAIVIQPKYIDKWIEDVQKTYGLEKKDIIAIQGGKDLRAIMMLAQADEIKASFIIISSATLQTYIKNYERFGEGIKQMDYPYLPHEFFKALGVGIRLIDEVHQSFHLYFKIDCFTHVPYSISLSATLLNLDPFMLNMYSIAYPIKMRYKDAALKKYIKVKAMMYSFKPNRNIRTEEYGSTMYSHHVFEKSIMRNKEALDNYLKLIDHTAQISYFKKYKPGSKLAIFASGVDMCTIIRNYFASKYPSMSVKRFVGTENDPYENLIESDIRVTTIQSGGTAHDIPNLSTVILTTAVESIQSNIQTVGRLRELTDRDTDFLYFVWQDNQKHMKYHLSKKENLRDRVATHNETVAPLII